MKRVNRKGLSDVVTTLLIILVAVAAVAIIGTIVLNQVQKGGSQIQATANCQQVDIYPIACSGTADHVNVTRRAGGTDVAPAGIKILRDTSGVVTVSNVIPTGLPAVGATATLSPMTGTPAAVLDLASSKVSVAAVFKASDGTDVTCDPSPTVVTCS